MKRMSTALLVIVPVLAVMGSCNFILGPDTPAADGEGGTGNLVISIGGADRAIAPGGTLPGDVLVALRYELTLTGPGGSTLTRTVSGGENLNMTVIVGGWRIDAWAYQDAGLAGTGSVDFMVGPGTNSVQVPMNMSGPCYEIDLPDYGSVGTVQSNFTAAFAGTEITITAVEGPDGVFTDPSLKVVDSSANPVADGPGTILTFTMPASDVDAAAEFGQVVLYAREGGSGSEDGTSWEDASGDLQAMMDDLSGSVGLSKPCVVKVGAGTYKPGTAGSWDSAFILREGVQVWGGYPAEGGEDSSRDVTANETVLSGDLDGDSSFSIDDAYHVVVGVNIPDDGKTVLDGLTISGGNAVGTSSSTVDSVPISQKNGGGMYNHYSSPALVNVTISGNTATDMGGGVYVSGGNFDMDSGTISGNEAGSGGGVYFTGTTFTMTGGTIGGTGPGEGNTATGDLRGGGGVLVAGGTFNMTEGTIVGNEAASECDGFNGGGGGVYVTGATFTMTGGTIAGNSAPHISGHGGGVSMSGGTFNMSGGTIGGSGEANTAVFRGGGVYVGGANFTMSGNAVISGNNGGSGGGGGVYLFSGNFSMTEDAVISNNYGYRGGGVRLDGGTFTKIGGTIYGNKKEDTTSEDTDLQNTADTGPAVGGDKTRNTTAGPMVNLDSGTAVNWE